MPPSRIPEASPVICSNVYFDCDNEAPSVMFRANESSLDSNADGHITPQEVERNPQLMTNDMSARYIQTQSPERFARFFSCMSPDHYWRIYSGIQNDPFIQDVRERFNTEIVPRLPASTLTTSPMSLEVPPPSPAGIYGPGSALFGQRTSILREYKEHVLNHPELLRFGSAIYLGSVDLSTPEGQNPGALAVFSMIPLSDRSAADVISRRWYESYCWSYGLNPDNAVHFSPRDFLGNSGVTFPNSQGVSVHVNSLGKVQIDPITNRSYYTPSFIIAMHELAHVERANILDHEHGLPFNTVTEEVASTVRQIILTDEVYKEIHQIPIESEVNYLNSYLTSRNEGLNPGRIANFFRRLLTRYQTVEQALMSPEGNAFISRYYSNNWTPELRQRADSASNRQAFPRRIRRAISL